MKFIVVEHMEEEVILICVEDIVSLQELEPVFLFSTTVVTLTGCIISSRMVVFSTMVHIAVIEDNKMDTSTLHECML